MSPRDILADFMPHGGTRAAFGYQTELQAVKDAIRRQRPGLVAWDCVAAGG